VISALKAAVGIREESPTPTVEAILEAVDMKLDNRLVGIEKLLDQMIEKKLGEFVA